ncbi:2,3-diaminopropionate biosynthesis protein SbnA [Planomonospora sphaerica]|uniref:2,3-diaminopropionate biosynthesis protein SbnA n=1 Tax=Planomonospora sphaerica TaxID=161355 RepID=A0A161LMV8_9ACTN|nr:pyridoxal-phosphate dependent enzyme [Planomonospora sphaerica]GAT68765.1 2,3-diaminopropionate biosynthesis protein SbnA [Planomonospora sphaerica]
MISKARQERVDDEVLLRELTSAAVWHAIGNTPLQSLRGLIPGPARLYGKLEGMNPGGSIKDRIAKVMLEHAIITGQVTRNSTIVESSSGNTAVGLAQLCAVAGLRLLAVIDPNTSPTNVKLLRAYGAEVVMVPAPDPVTGEFLPARLTKVRELLAANPGAFWPDQYTNRAVLQAHLDGTMPEIAAQLGHPPDYLYVPVSTCGTLAGCSLFLRRHGWATRLVAVDVHGSRIFADPPRGVKRSLPGMGAPFTPPFAEGAEVWRTEYISEDDCLRSCRDLTLTNGILAGASSGAVVSAARHVLADAPGPATHVLILPDRGERYLDRMFADAYTRP